jgi:hypothetical protein
LSAAALSSSVGALSSKPKLEDWNAVRACSIRVTRSSADQERTEPRWSGTTQP